MRSARDYEFLAELSYPPKINMYCQEVSVVKSLNPIRSRTYYEEERNCCRRRGWLSDTQQNGYHHHTDREGRTTPDHRPSSTHTIEVQRGDSIANWKHDLDETSYEQSSVRLNTNA